MGLGRVRDIAPTMENQMEQRMENAMDTGCIHI